MSREADLLSTDTTKAGEMQTRNVEKAKERDARDSSKWPLALVHQKVERERGIGRGRERKHSPSSGADI